MRDTVEPLAGVGLMQSEEEWELRGQVLASSLSAMIARHRVRRTGRGIDVGCQRGGLIDQIADDTGLDWVGIDPGLDGPMQTARGAQLTPGRASAIPYEDASFDAAVFANVFEHVEPDDRQASLDEIHRVLGDGGVVVGQIPNPYFPIESHSRLPFMGWLPLSAQRRYWSMSKVPWDHDFFVVTMRHLRRHAAAAGFSVVESRPFNYPLEVIPQSVRPLARAAAPIMRAWPWAWQFVLRKPETAANAG